MILLWNKRERSEDYAMKVIIDTNVIIDVYQNRRDFVDNSSAILKLSENGKINGIVTANTITDIFYILGRAIKDNKRLRELVKKLLTIVTLADITANDIYNTFDIPMNDYEDALLACIAKKLKTDYIVTGNTNHFLNSPVTALKPSEFLNNFFPA